MSGSLDHKPSQIVRQLLIDLGEGTNPADNSDWPIYATTRVDSPDGIIAVRGSSSEKQGRDMNDGEVKERYLVQIVVRGANDTSMYAKASSILLALDKSVRLKNVVLGSTTYLVYAASRKSGPLALGREDETRGRVLCSLNYSVAIKRAA